MRAGCGRRGMVIVGALLMTVFSGRARLQSPSLDTQLLLAAGKGDVAAVGALLDKGANVNADNGHGVTALAYAADQANVELAKLLLARGANPNIQDLEYGKPPLRVAAVPWSDIKAKEARRELVTLLVEKGAGSDGESLGDVIRAGFYDAAKTIVSRGKMSPSYLNLALAAARRAQQPDLVEMLTKAGAKEPGPLDQARSRERLTKLSGVFRNEQGQELRLARSASFDDQLLLQRAGQDPVALLPADLTILRSFDLKTVVRLQAAVLPPAEVTLSDPRGTATYRRVGDLPVETTTSARTPRPAAAPAAAAPSAATAVVPRVREWSSFRGPAATGIGDGFKPPTTWDMEKGTNIKWKTPIPGFAHSSPIIWGDKVYVTTAVSLKETKLVFQHGRVGDDEGGGASAYTKDDVPHSWRVYALDKNTGKILWQRVAHEGVPKTQRHVMESQANATPATNGEQIVAFFGSEGLYCYDVAGKLLWKKDLGALSSGRYLDASYEWNTASSPIIFKNTVILQVDIVEHSYIAAFDLKTGKEVWKTARDEQPSWPTPMIYEGQPRTELVTAAPLFTRAYDPSTGKELWRLGKHSALSTPTPVAGSGLIFITSGGGTTVQPIYAIRPGGSGDITLKDGEDTNEFVAWSQHRGGAYIPTPLVYQDILYLCSNNGIVAAFEATTGKRVYQARLAQGGGSTYSASPVAADGKLYFSSEDGDVTVVKAGPKFEIISVNKMDQLIMATPAIAPGLLVFRMQHDVVAVAEGSAGSGAARP